MDSLRCSFVNDTSNAIVVAAAVVAIVAAITADVHLNFAELRAPCAKPFAQRVALAIVE